MSKKAEMELSDCCNKPVYGSYPHCSKCLQPCSSHTVIEDYYDEITADDERGMSDDQIQESIDELP